MKTITIIFSIFLFTATTVSAQIRPLLPKYYLPIDQSQIEKDKKDSNESEDSQKKQTYLKFHDRLTYNVTIGTGYTSFSNNISLMSTYISPSINYQASDKLFINVSGIIMKNNYNGTENLSTYSPVDYNSNAANYGITGSVHYQLSNNWSIYGDGTYYENQSIISNYQNQNYNTDYKSVSLGIGYKISDKVQFNAQFRYSNGLNPAFNPYSPFYNSSAIDHSNFGIWGY